MRKGKTTMNSYENSHKAEKKPILRRNRISEYEYMQFGCGYNSNPQTWLNFDASPTLFIQQLPLVGFIAKKTIKPLFPVNISFGNILNDLPLKENSLKGIYCSHVLEHLSLQDFRLALKKTYFFLKPGGFFA